MKPTLSVLLALAIAAVLGVGYWQFARQPPPAGPAAADLADAASAAPGEASAVSQTGDNGDAAPPTYPIAAASAAAAEPASASPPAAEPDLAASIEGLFGREAVLALFVTDALVTRTVATIDNLGRGLAPARLWPVVQPEGRFTVQAGTEPGGGEIIAASNHARYARHLALLERADPARVAALYKAHYPQFQRAYAELGFPRRYFNDRLVQVIDLLLATPEPAGAVRVDLPEVQGPTQPVRPWVLYEFSEPALRPLRVGQKILLRLSPTQRGAAKAWLAALRSQIT
jgi:hypothetical protein